MIYVCTKTHNKDQRQFDEVTLTNHVFCSSDHFYVQLLLFRIRTKKATLELISSTGNN